MMATSGTRTFIMTRDQIITDALSKINAIGLGDTPTSAMLSEAQTILNMMVQHWQNFNIFLWTVSDDIITLESGTATYYLGSEVLDVDNLFFRDDSGTDIVLESITRESYSRLNDKDQAGSPSQVYVDYQTDGPHLTFFPVYDDTDGEVGYTKTIRLQDFSASTDNPDFPARWYKALCFGLAVDLSPTWGRLSSAAFDKLALFSENARNQAKFGQYESSNMQFRVKVK